MPPPVEPMPRRSSTFALRRRRSFMSPSSLPIEGVVESSSGWSLGTACSGTVPGMSEPWEMTAARALAAMRALDLSPIDLLDS
ncbi:MAG TPA: hypothetical protein VNC60_06735, partial [Actinomycetota bacterium]|nr:hypothetical protein [Actinomycetota bacterium]